MPNNSQRCARRRGGRQHIPKAAATVITNPMDCCALEAESVAQELYTPGRRKILVENCCDPFFGCNHMSADLRCDYWPSFAHPRWLSCRQLHNKVIR